MLYVMYTVMGFLYNHQKFWSQSMSSSLLTKKSQDCCWSVTELELLVIVVIRWTLDFSFCDWSWQSTSVCSDEYAFLVSWLPQPLDNLWPRPDDVSSIPSLKDSDARLRLLTFARSILSWIRFIVSDLVSSWCNLLWEKWHHHRKHTDAQWVKATRNQNVDGFCHFPSVWYGMETSAIRPHHWPQVSTT